MAYTRANYLSDMLALAEAANKALVQADRAVRMQLQANAEQLKLLRLLAKEPIPAKLIPRKGKK